MSGAPQAALTLVAAVAGALAVAAAVPSGPPALVVPTVEDLGAEFFRAETV